MKHTRKGFLQFLLAVPLLKLFGRYQVKSCKRCGKLSHECWMGFYSCDSCFYEVVARERDSIWRQNHPPPLKVTHIDEARKIITYEAVQ